MNWRYVTMATKILFLSANPKETQELELIKEFNDIDAKLRAADKRDEFDLVQRHAISTNGLMEILLRYKPQIVHFSGHGSNSSALIFENSERMMEEVPPDVLTELFKILSEDIHCVFLNACYSEKQAEAIAKYVDCVIGISGTISDFAARQFAVQFYLALGSGMSVIKAFELGVVQLKLLGIPEDHKPKLKLKDGTDPGKVFALPENGNRGMTLNYDNLRESLRQTRKRNISIQEFWEVDGKGNLEDVLELLRTHSNDYGMGQIEKSTIEGYLNSIPPKLRDWDLVRYESSDARRKLESELLGEFTRAVDFIAQLFNRGR